MFGTAMYGDTMYGAETETGQSGQIAGGSSVAGRLLPERGVTSYVASLSTVVATAERTRGLTTTIAAHGGATAGADLRWGLRAMATGQASSHATQQNVVRKFAGSSASSTTLAGRLSLKRTVTAVVHGAASTSGSVRIRAALTALSTGSSSVVGSTSVLHRLAATITSAGQAGVSMMQVTRTIMGRADGEGGADGVPLVLLPVFATVQGVATAMADRIRQAQAAALVITAVWPLQKILSTKPVFKLRAIARSAFSTLVQATPETLRVTEAL